MSAFMWLADGRTIREDYIEEDLKQFVTVEDVALVLSRAARFNGWGNYGQGPIYSVAQHSIYVSLRVAKKYKCDKAKIPLYRAALFHDAPEIVTGDIIRPMLSVLLPNDDFDVLLNKARYALGEALSCDLTSFQPEIYEFDNKVLATEARDLFGQHIEASSEIQWMFEPLEDLKILSWEQKDVIDCFLGLSKILSV